MDVKQAFLLAIHSLRANKLRSILTMLGMIIGVAAVIILVSLGNGVTTYIEEVFASFGANVISVATTYTGNNIIINQDDIQEFVNNSKTVKAFTPYYELYGITCKYGTESHSTTVNGVNETYANMREMKITSGRFIQYIDCETNQNVCVVGQYIVDELFEDIEPIGKQIRVNGNLFTIVGVLEGKQEDVPGGSDDIIIIPYTVASRKFKTGKLGYYMFSYYDPEMADEAEKEIDEYFAKIFTQINDDAYIVINAKDLIDQLFSILDTITSFLVLIAGISLIVGGIGIMNIMLVSVTERTKEIGIRKALGARQRDILAQFVIEAITTSVIGGIIGIVSGISLSFVIASLIDLKPTVSILSIIVATGVSGLIGVTFGYLPAKKAAQLHPIDALRYE